MKGFLQAISSLALIVIAGLGGAMLFPKLELLFPYTADNFWHCSLAGLSLGALTSVYTVFIVPFVLNQVLDFTESNSSQRTSAIGSALYILNTFVLAAVVASIAFLVSSYINGSHLGTALVTLLATVGFNFIFFYFRSRD